MSSEIPTGHVGSTTAETVAAELVRMHANQPMSSPSSSTSSSSSSSSSAALAGGDGAAEKRSPIGIPAGVSSPDDASSHPRRLLKKTCESCAKSKVKCEGSHPCLRCSKRGVDCVFLMEQKRGRRLGVTDDPSLSRMTKRPTLATKPVVHKLPRLQPPTVSALPLAMNNPQYQEQLRHLQQQHLQQQQKMMMVPGPRPPMAMPQFIGARMPMQFPAMVEGAAPHVTMAWAPAGPMAPFATFSPGMMTFPSMVPTVPGGLIPPGGPTVMMAQPAFLQRPVAAAAGNFANESNVSSFERRLIRALFALYKHNNKAAQAKDEMRSQWFESRFNTLWTMMTGRLTPEEEHQLTSWCFANRIRVDKSLALGSFNPSARRPCPNFANVGRASAFSGEPAGMSIGTVRVLSFGQIECSDDFTSTMGYSSEELTSKTWPAGFLPWGAEVLASIAHDDQDVYAYLRSLAAVLAASKPESGSGIVKAQCQRSMSLNHKNGIRLDCNVVSEVIESITPDGSLLVGVTLKFYLAPPEQVFLPQTTLELGPWPSGAAPGQSWLQQLLKWVDAGDQA